jgi:hypothetical protein
MRHMSWALTFRFKNTVFWVVIPCSPTAVCRRFERVYCLHHQGRKASQRNKHIASFGKPAYTASLLRSESLPWEVQTSALQFSEPSIMGPLAHIDAFQQDGALSPGNSCVQVGGCWVRRGGLLDLLSSGNIRYPVRGGRWTCGRCRAGNDFPEIGICPSFRNRYKFRFIGVSCSSELGRRSCSKLGKLFILELGRRSSSELGTLSGLEIGRRSSS